jgi:hypothetical protein
VEHLNFRMKNQRSFDADGDHRVNLLFPLRKSRLLTEPAVPY